MKKAALLVVIFLVGVAGLVVWRQKAGRAGADKEGLGTGKEQTTKPPPKGTEPPKDVKPTLKPIEPAKVSPAESKADRIAKIAKDYEEVVNKAAAEFGALGAAFPGGLSAYLRQLALLEREKWKDYADILTPRELEDLQMREHNAGKLVTKLLGDSAATDDQRRAVLRLQREFNDKHALIFDLTAASLGARELERQALQEKIIEVLGPGLTATWLQGEGEDFGRLTQYVERNALRPEAALEVWRIKNESTRRRLEIAAQGLSAAETASAYAAVVEQTRARVVAILGPAALQAPAASGIPWLPTK